MERSRPVPTYLLPYLHTPARVCEMDDSHDAAQRVPRRNTSDGSVLQQSRERQKTRAPGLREREGKRNALETPGRRN